ncbi:branched-chain amino acid ABC transporter permease [Ruoffia tabacinasalis]|uniref:Branched-chain amino acid ABC transporter permease n=1 Tax=Ruoffia tabacinasalis TaxID=87458 RepID=A0A5R9DWK2_9LACT|nr:AzlC family ABC transporter permease [Ruoffia tabacinasalis]TLQ41653.1 branched-chain amino acid ABC transporter permease [Ruoffia tabacinasalis]
MKEAFKFAFPHTIPIMAGYIFLGIPFGLLAVSQGFSPLFAILMSVIIYSGAIQYAAIDVFLASFNPMNAIILTLMVGARHIFYGIAMLTKFSKLDSKKYYTIFGLTDETFSVLVSIDVPENLSRDWVYFFITLLNQMYWVSGTVIGVLLGSMITINLEGIDFVLTALFITIFVDQWLNSSSKVPALVGILSGLLCLVLFGANNFMIPAMVFILGFFLYRFNKKGVARQ